jgi:hypothetical protein
MQRNERCGEGLQCDLSGGSIGDVQEGLGEQRPQLYMYAGEVGSR